MTKKLKAIELFAGVGGFRLGLEGWEGKSSTTKYNEHFESRFKVVWSNQWEPSTKIQHASMVYEKHWGSNGHSNEDISTVEIDEIPDHDLLVGGFPCQDYSVATTLKNSKGLIGKKGVLWWSIQKILSEKKKKPKCLFLENVDRLLISPSKQRGRDFAIILKSLDELGYAVEWRVVNAADYGLPQRRRRVFILAYHKSSNIYKKIKKSQAHDWLTQSGVIAEALPVSGNIQRERYIGLSENIVSVSNDFNKIDSKQVFENTGLMISGGIFTMKTESNYSGKSTPLKTVLERKNIPENFFISDEDFEKWQYLKGPKKEIRIKSDGYEYHYSEGGMIFPDPLDKPSRTIITGEGGKSPSRFKHVVTDKERLRRLMPIELERLNMFPDNHTYFDTFTDTKRAFFMGNALVVGVVEKISISLAKHWD